MAEIQHNRKAAKQLWVRVLAASPADPEAIDGIERLSRDSGTASEPLPPVSPPAPTPRAVTPAPDPKASPAQMPKRPKSSPARSKAAPQQTGSSEPRRLSLPYSLNSPASRRNAIKIVGFAGGSIGATLIGRALLQLDSNTPTDSDTTVVPANTPLAASAFASFDFDTVKVNETGEITSREAKQGKVFKEAVGDVTFNMVAIAGGSFMMGSPEGQGGEDEKPQHEVTVPSFLMSKYPVTQAQWRAVAGLPKINRNLTANPAHFEGDDRPVEQVSWDDATEFCQRLTKHTDREYRLPSEAEWEYACRAGTTPPFYFGETLTSDIANYDANYTYGSGPKGEYRQQTTEVATFPANAFGLYDMHGNVWEWCLDHWHENYEGAPADGSAWLEDGEADRRVLRGGSWDSIPVYCRSADRYWVARDLSYNYVGFRVVCASSWTLG
ncbi:MAG: formylglycine-generating enzyme family protein [Leptolyngbya sp. SIO4C1]|nr:formylglycine-generating enzyme family protein [Leptolyngbya sp. SIO4C1]